MKQTFQSTHPHLRQCWADDPANPGRMLLSDPAAQRLIAAISPQSQATDLGGVMSLNVRLDAAGLVLRVHQPTASRQRLLAVQAVRRSLPRQGLLVPRPMSWHKATVFRCRDHWAELDEYIPHQRLGYTLDAYVWLFGEMGVLHNALAQLALTVPRPRIATYAPPGSLRRWLPVTEAAVQHNPEAAAAAQLLRSLIQQLSRQWVPASKLPTQLIHGDVRLSNICQAEADQTVIFDFGFMAHRPRIHDLAYALAFMLLGLGGYQRLDDFDWQIIPQLLEAYEAAARVRLTPTERIALAPYTASVPLYAAALDGFTENPTEKLRSRHAFLQLSQWLLAHPTILL